MLSLSPLNLCSIWKEFLCVVWSRGLGSFFSPIWTNILSQQHLLKILSYSPSMHWHLFVLICLFFCSIDVLVYFCIYSNCLNYCRYLIILASSRVSFPIISFCFESVRNSWRLHIFKLSNQLKKSNTHTYTPVENLIEFMLHLQTI